MPDLIVTDRPSITANEFLMAKDAAETLHTAYPNHLWAVDIQGSVMNVRNMMLAGNWGFTLHIPSIYSASEWKKQILRAGGEILERYRQARGRMDQEKMLLLPTDRAGRHQPDL